MSAALDRLREAEALLLASLRWVAQGERHQLCACEAARAGRLLAAQLEEARADRCTEQADQLRRAALALAPELLGAPYRSQGEA